MPASAKPRPKVKPFVIKKGVASGKENLLHDRSELVPSSHGIKITIPPKRSDLDGQPAVPGPTDGRRLQPGRPNKAARMAEIIANLEEDDSGTLGFRQVQRKRQIVLDSDDERDLALSAVPEGVARNPMAPPATKKRKTQTKPPQGPNPKPMVGNVPPQLPLQAALPERAPPDRSFVELQPPQSQHPQGQPPIQSHSQPSHIGFPPPSLRSQPSKNSSYSNPLASVQRRGSEHNNEDYVMGDDTPREDDDDIYVPEPYHQTQTYSPILRPEDIDERSPSEDEEAGLRVLRGETQPEAPQDRGRALAEGRWDDTTDVLNDHRTRNRANKPPSQQHLLNAAKHQLQQYPDTDDDEGEHGGKGGEVRENEEEHGDEGGEVHEDEGDDGVDGQSEEDEECLKKRATRNSKSDGTISPKTAGYYPDSWRAAIDRAKEHFRRFTFLQNLFPSRDLNLADAEEVLSKVIADTKAKKKLFDNRYSQTRDMNIVVFKEAATYRLKLIDHTRKVFLRYYGDALGTTANIESQIDYNNNIAANVRKLIGKESHFHYGKDALGKRVNFGHPGIEALCIEFFFGRSGGNVPLAALFPEEFSTTIPEHAVATVMTSIYACINEYRSGDFNQSEFSRANYLQAYEGILRIMELVNGSAFHQAQWKRRRQAWAEKGMRLLHPPKKSDICEFSVDLSDD